MSYIILFFSLRKKKMRLVKVTQRSRISYRNHSWLLNGAIITLLRGEKVQPSSDKLFWKSGKFFSSAIVCLPQQVGAILLLH